MYCRTKIAFRFNSRPYICNNLHKKSFSLTHSMLRISNQRENTNHKNVAEKKKKLRAREVEGGKKQREKKNNRV